jgi:hypothetical protein
MFKISQKYIILIIILIGIAFLYNRYKDKLDKEHHTENYDIIQKYLLNTQEDQLLSSKKPILWIHITTEYNSRFWESFGSRSNSNLNQPYIYLTIKSIITKCEHSFHICIIDDDSFPKLIPDWSIDMTSISDPILNNMRQLAMMKLLYIYGGLIVPQSFLCLKDLLPIYDLKKMIVCENVNRNASSVTHDMYPDLRFVGSPKKNSLIKELGEYIQYKIYTDYTDQSTFLGDLNRWCYKKREKGEIKEIDGKLIGTKTLDNKCVLLDDLMSNDFIKFYANMYGIYIPSDEILNRRKYEWYARLSPEQVLEANVILSKYMISANIPAEEKRETEAKNKAYKKEHIHFWKVPSTAPLWGFKPLNLGDNLLKK